MVAVSFSAIAYVKRLAQRLQEEEAACRCRHLVSFSPRICARAFTFRANDSSVRAWQASCITSAHEFGRTAVFSSIE
jgi:hypothetical protein